MIAVLSDIHGNLEAFDSVLDDIVSRGISKFIILGDIIDYGADSLKVLNKIKTLKNIFGYDCVLLRGNHEDSVINNDSSLFSSSHGVKSFYITYKELTDEIDNINKLFKQSTEVRYNKLGSVTVCHGMYKDCWFSPHNSLKTDSYLSLSNENNCDIVIGGHSHIQGFCKLNKCTYYINPGSIGQPRNGDSRAQYMICNDDMTDFEFIRIMYDSESASKKITKSGRPEFLAHRILFGI